MSKILVTGGAGYIGSHTCVELIEAGYNILVIDNFSNSCPEALKRVEQITGKSIAFEQIDIRDANSLEELFSRHQFEAVIHFAGLKAVGESCQIPLEYYQNNVSGTLNLCQTMKAHGCHNLVFSSSATVYGEPASLPITEDFPLSATNPYGRSKLIIEDMMRDLHKSDNNWNILLLRYFNPAGAHPSGLIGEDPNGIPNNLMPYISQVAIGKLEKLQVFGDDYDTVDGTGVRDYIHVVDLAKGHVKALDKLNQKPGCTAYNLGVGSGYSVLQMAAAFAKISGREIPHEIVERRPGDIANCYADPSLAMQALGWQAELGLEAMVEDGWNWQKKNMDGYHTN
ncbi:UDP-glucose 4-epimerase GalE [Aestuariirhabdus sp. Z084]|uniref:UDP-glucose 4-epimerase GalE n=1 Tax=Aestuariirhabdus haliotis TaxID=2918751 RepID=UPI00201B44B3|nr:UDP-glucose 4-epimerase GalE [Aestuariirhabdus haliotis]MCL6417543.1 UDP-glucose 4-epimerase GalE [Aestuariirhabdus haliotis]MCL6421502.1 UDP-glucose 4-epimerase GalE [Aestuariirhabdus haliotis]